MSFLSRHIIFIILAASQILNMASPTQCDELRSNDFSLEMALNNFFRSKVLVIRFLIKSWKC